MQKKSKRVFAAVVAVLMVLSVGYFALLAPTTAWFNQQETILHQFTFGDFDVDEEVTEDIDDEIPLRAATRFADLGEDLFDEVAHVVQVDVTNYGELDANVQVVVKDNKGTDNDADDEELDVTTSELKWFVTDTLPEEGTSGEYVANRLDDDNNIVYGKGVYKTAIENMLTGSGVTLKKYGYTDAGTVEAKADAESAYETYNSNSAIPALAENNEKGIDVSTDETKTVYVVFWAEYGTIAGDFAAASDKTHEYNVTIEFNAAPALDDYKTAPEAADSANT